jgi:S-adenosylmethionine/arginine decarboxylase-like enzyme
LDLSGCPAEKLIDVALIFNLLEEVPLRLGMSPIGSPSVFKYTGREAGDGGVTGVVLIEDAHLSIHTFPDRGRAVIELFSCRDFAVDLAKQLLLEAFAASEHELTMVNRSEEADTPLEEHVSPRVFH